MSADAKGETTRAHGPAEHEPTPPWWDSDFEQRRAIAAARAKLFGGTSVLRIGRFEIVERIGAGGMGEVYRAVDPDLDRSVAIKRLRDDLHSAGVHARLRSEALALAKLAHPNVVGIHEVGEHEGRGYIVMEYVEGTSLRTWMQAERSWSDIVAAYLAAGRGLAAAHTAGILHRDFKPDNVLVGADGRICVADFGLALAHEDTNDGAHADEIAGTIRYMSPEQLRGKELDERSDQFGFCVALYEALWGRVPFDAGDVEQRMRQLERDEPVVPPRLGPVPGWLWAPIRRGLRCERERRWPSLDELLDRLERTPRRRQRSGRAALTVGLMAVLTGVLVAHDESPEDGCDQVADELAWLSDPEQQVRLRSALLDGPIPHSKADVARIHAELERWSKAWTRERTEQCRAAASKRDTSEVAHARRACLERQRRVVELSSEAVGAGDPVALTHALAVVEALPEPARCSAARALDTSETSAPEQREAITELRLALSELRTRRELGHGSPPHARALRARAEALDHGPTTVEALIEEARTELDAGSPKLGLARLDEAEKLSLVKGDRRGLARALTRSALVRLTRYPSDDADYRLELAEAAWRELEPDPGVRASLSFGRSLVSSGEEARTHLAHALELASPTQRPAFVSALANHSQPDEALALREDAVELATQAFGPEHPETAVFIYNLGVTLRARGEFDRARPLFGQAIAIWTHAYEQPHPNLALVYHLLADAELSVGQLDDAEAHAHELARMHAQTLPPTHPQYSDALHLLGRIAAQRGNRARALALSREVLDLYLHSDAPNAKTALELQLDVSSNELGLGRFDAARRNYEQLLGFTEDPHGRGQAHVGLAEIELRLGELERARAHLDEVEALGVEVLGDQQISFAIVDGLVRIRGGCRGCEPELAANIARVMKTWDWNFESLQEWLVELEVTPDEARRLGFAPD